MQIYDTKIFSSFKHFFSENHFYRSATYRRTTPCHIVTRTSTCKRASLMGSIAFWSTHHPVLVQSFRVSISKANDRSSRIYSRCKSIWNPFQKRILPKFAFAIISNPENQNTYFEMLNQFEFTFFNLKAHRLI